MPKFENLLAGVTGRISCEEDFTFPKLKGELALRVRSEWLPRMKDSASLQFAEVGLDDDGEIEVRTDRGTLFVTGNTVTVSTSGMTVASILEGQGLRGVAVIIDELFKLRAPLRPLQYDIRFFFRLQFNDLLSAEQWRDSMCQIGASPLFAEAISSSMLSAQWSVAYGEEVFSDSLQLDASLARIQVRQSRTAPADQFPSFEAFIGGAHVPVVLERLRPSFGPFIKDASKLRAGWARE